MNHVERDVIRDAGTNIHPVLLNLLHCHWIAAPRARAAAKLAKQDVVLARPEDDNPQRTQQTDAGACPEGWPASKVISSKARSPRTSEHLPSVGNLARVTRREKEVLVQLAKGHTNLEIAKQLGIQESTVKLHVHNLLEKLKVRNRAEAALSGIRVSDIQQKQIEEAERGRLDLSWLHPEMSHRRMRAGQWIFRLGDAGSELFYVQRGSVSLPEVGEKIERGGVFGEIGIFAPERSRTSSARCETEVDLFSLSGDQVRRTYFANPRFAFFMITLVAARLMADLRRHAM